MKKGVILFVGLCTVLFSCYRESVTGTYYKITNQSSQEIKITVAGFMYWSDDTTFYLSPMQQLEYCNTVMGGAILEPFGGKTNQAWAIFNNKDTIQYTLGDISCRNILKRENYQEKIEESKRKRTTNYHYSYTFTEADYQNAVEGKK
jgi:hypothetical protein